MRFKRGLAGLASVGAVIAVGAIAPSAAMAHPCAGAAEASLGKTLTLHTGSDWAGVLPSSNAALGHECGEDFNSYVYAANMAETSAMGEPIGDAISTFNVSRLRGLGYSARNVPLTGTGNGVYNSDLAFKDNLVIQGTYEGFRIVDFTDKSNPTQIINYTGCTVGQGDVIVYGNILVRSWDAPASSSATCAGQLVGQGFEGIHIFDISNPAQPQFIRALRFASNNPGLVGCGSHTATAVPDPARDHLYIYNGGSSGTCSGIDVFRIKISDPNEAVVLRRASNGRTGNSCHDNNVLMGVGGGTVGYAMCAGGNGLSMYAFDMAKTADEAGTPQSPGGVANPTLMWAKQIEGVGVGHSGSFTYDGKLLIFGHEPGGGSDARCQATSTVVEKTLFFIDPANGDVKGTMLHPRPQTNRENCTWHNFNVVPTEAGYFAVVGSYQSGISVLEFTNPAAPRELAFADPAPLQTPDPAPTVGIILGGDWSTYWHNGYIFESDIKRGLVSWELNLPTTGTAGASVAEAREQLRHFKTYGLSNPQTQIGSYQQNPGATIAVRSPVEGQAYKANSEVIADFDCADDTAVVSCVGTVADGSPVSTTLGNKVFRVTATDSNGTRTIKDVPYVVNSVDYTIAFPTANVDTTLSLTMPTTSPSLGTLQPGVTRDYLASGAFSVTSTAGNAAITIHDADTTATGRLVNGTAMLTQPLSVFATSTNAAAVAQAGGPLSGGAAAPTPLMNYTAPVTNSPLTMIFRQNVTATETLRTGTYGKTLTVTLSTTSP